MKTYKINIIKVLILCLLCISTGCSVNQSEIKTTENTNTEETVVSDNENNFDSEAITPDNNNIQIDLSDYFQGIIGCAVINNLNEGQYLIYNQELSEKRSSPCSTFKIISTIIGLESGVLESKDTVIEWNGTQYFFDEWNQDLTLEQAFQSSCVWYFRGVIDQAGEEKVKEVLTTLSYGNGDISQWTGSNTHSDYSELNGFWLESSLLISPREQVDTLFRIFEDETDIREDYIHILKEIMQIDNSGNNSKVFGKTGTGYKDNACVDAWFVGIAENENHTYYYAIRLDEPTNDSVSGQKAKEIALNIINDYFSR